MDTIFFDFQGVFLLPGLILWLWRQQHLIILSTSDSWEEHFLKGRPISFYHVWATHSNLELNRIKTWGLWQSRMGESSFLTCLASLWTFGHLVAACSWRSNSQTWVFVFATTKNLDDNLRLGSHQHGLWPPPSWLWICEDDSGGLLVTKPATSKLLSWKS